MKSRVLLAVAFLAFVSLGLPDTLLGIAWPFVHEHFGLPHPFMGFVLIVTSFGYFISSSGVAGLMRRMPIGVLLAYSSGLVALGEFGFALSPAWIIFIGSGVLHGLGSGAIDAGLNHFAAVRFSARQMNWLHASYSLGATAGPTIMTTAIVAAGSWRTGYGIVGGLLAALASPQARLQIALFFFYAGIEVGVGQWSFTLLTTSRGLSVADAGSWVTLYWVSIFGGRVAGARLDQSLCAADDWFVACPRLPVSNVANTVACWSGDLGSYGRLSSQRRDDRRIGITDADRFISRKLRFRNRGCRHRGIFSCRICDPRSTLAST